MSIFSLDMFTVTALFLACAVIFLNGFTDAPNAIATTVATGALSMNKACFLCSACNVIGLFAMTRVSTAVADSVLRTADFADRAGPCVCAALGSVVIFSGVSWLLSMPSSESHALLGGIWGAMLALDRKISILPILKILLWMLVLCLVSAFASLFISRLLRGIQAPYKKLQIFSCAASSLLHGAQDGQKLLGILIVILLTPNAKMPSQNYLCLTVCLLLGLGSLLGGGRIVKSMGEDITPLTPKSALISDISATLCLVFCSFLGILVSTSNIKACSVAGAGLGEKSAINCKLLWRIAIVSLVTIPVCMLISLAIVRILL